jgi:hypothetical protein
LKPVDPRILHRREQGLEVAEQGDPAGPGRCEFSEGADLAASFRKARQVRSIAGVSLAENGDPGIHFGNPAPHLGRLRLPTPDPLLAADDAKQCGSGQPWPATAD